MKDIVILANNTDVGKTHVAKNLIRVLSKRGIKTGVFKPVESGVDGVAVDGKALLESAQKYNENLKVLKVDDVVGLSLKLPAAPFVANNLQDIDMDRIYKKYKKIKEICDIVLIESAGGIFSPVNRNFFMFDLVDFFDSKGLLITHSKLGCISDTLSSIEILKSKKIDFVWAINQFDSSFDTISKPFFDNYFPSYNTLPRDYDKLVSEILKR